ncbi:outer membrane protein assembly factor BamD [Myxococcota bacterium]|nr:outer membrane protein assembly factor BamD [Myxococcota bacterium]
MKTHWLVASVLTSLMVLLCGCSKPDPSFEDVPPAKDLYEKGLKILEGGTLLYVIPRVNYSDAIETFQTIIDNYPYSDYAVLSELRIADAYFDQDKYEEALSYYRDFGDLHPQNEKVPYTLYRAALCHERRMKSPNRDQTATRDALVYLDRLIYSYPHSEYTLKAEELWRALRLQLGEQIMGIADFYLGREEFESAAARYRSLLNEYPGLGLDAMALYRLGRCYLEMNRNEEAGRIFQAIVQNYYDTDAAREAEQMLAREQ